MNKKYGYMEIYSDILDYLESGERDKNDIFSYIISRASLTSRECSDSSVNGCRNTLRVKIGSMLSEMEKKGVISKTEDGKFRSATEKPVALRAEMCEAEIINFVRATPSHKDKIKAHLIKFFGTDKTKTKHDDNVLNSLVTDTLKQLVRVGVLDFDGSIYSIKKESRRKADDMHELALLKADFLSLLHSKGGEFFEYYFMNLISKYLTKHGKTVRECNVTGGSADGGIDGIVYTTDSLGFRETVMIQTKNRNDYTTEIDVRGFYGAVCAKRGSRGIYAITSRFHPSAEKFLDELDDCIGIDGERIFEMACECEYGLVKSGEDYIIDNSVI